LNEDSVTVGVAERERQGVEVLGPVLGRLLAARPDDERVADFVAKPSNRIEPSSFRNACPMTSLRSFVKSTRMTVILRGGQGRLEPRLALSLIARARARPRLDRAPDQR
jgi:hypothetical protein